MKEKLEQLLQHAYSPYYHFPVAAIVVMKDGTEFCGVNVENANGTSICAERNAIAAAVAHGYQRGDFQDIHLMLADGKIGYPCMACRQVLLEFMEPSCLVKSYSSSSLIEEHTIQELCPYAFSSEDLQ